MKFQDLNQPRYFQYPAMRLLIMMAKIVMAMQAKPINIDAVKNIAAEVTCSIFDLCYGLKGTTK